MEGSLISSEKMADLLVDLSDGVLTLTFNRPLKRNAITQEMIKKIIDALVLAEVDDDIKVCVLTGIGSFFSSGNDFGGIPTTFVDLDLALKNFKNFVATLINYQKMIVAVVNGPAIGMACTILALCDVVYASEDAYFQTPFSLLGLVPEACSTYTFPRIFGAAKAAKLLYLSETMNAQEAASLGFVTQVFPQEDLQMQSNRHIKDLASLPVESLKHTKRIVRRWDCRKLKEANEVEVNTLMDRFQAKDFLKAITDPNTTTKIKSKL